MAIKAVGFDWDGTLINFLDVKIKNAGQIYAAAYGIDNCRIEAAYKKHSGISRRLLFDRLAQDTLGRGLDEDEYSRLSQQFDEFNDTALTSDKLYPNVFTAVDEQRSKGRIVYVSSSVPHDTINNITRKLGLIDLFHEVMGSDFQGGKGPGHTRYITEKYGLVPGEIAFVGDELKDIDLGIAAGVRVIGVTNTYPADELKKAGTDETIDDLSELADALEKI